MKTVIIIPTYNEKNNIVPTTKAVLSAAKKSPKNNLHILFVDDNSPDKTADEVRKLMNGRPQVHLLLNKKKGGLGKAYKKGMIYALDKLKADVVFEFDADLSHDPDKIPQMLAKVADGYDLVLGSRYIKGGGIPENWGIHRKFLSIAGNLTARLILTNFSIKDWTTGYRAIKKEVIESVVPQLNSKKFSGYTWQIGFLHKTVRSGFKVAEVPFKFQDRTWGRSKLGPEYIINTLSYILKERTMEIINSRIFKFAVVGGVGAFVQLASLQIWRQFFPFQLAFFLAIETAIVSNFIWNNVWTFSDRKLKTGAIPGKFLQFNLTSAGSILIQQAIALVGERFIGLFPLFVLPVINFVVDTGTMYAVIGIGAGMFWNFFAYNRFIWRAKKK